MVHTALLTADIVSIISESSDKRSLSVLARTARFLHVPALRELWRDMKLPHVLFSFGSSVKLTEWKLSFCNDPTSTQWDRFDFYAQFVRDLTIPLFGPDIEIEPPSFAILSHHQPLLPRLKSLHVFGHWKGQEIPSLSMFFVPSLQRFNIQTNLATDSILMTLSTTASALRHLDLTGLHFPLILNPFSITISSITISSLSLFHNLYSIAIPSNGLQIHSILSHLSTLPSLLKMHFSITGLARISGTGPKYHFPATRELEIRSEFEDQPPNFLALTCFDNLSNLTISCSNNLVDDDSLCRAISVSCGHSLNQIKIGYIGYGRMDPGTVKSSTLDTLSKFTNLRSFTWDAVDTLWPTDDDILDIAKAWPNLEEFSVHPVFVDIPIYPLTLTGLLHLIEACPNLVEISVPVNAFHLPNFTNAISRPGLVINVDPGYSHINTSRPLAEFLFLALPDANIMLGWGAVNENCGTWMDALTLHKDFRMKGRI